MSQVRGVCACAWNVCLHSCVARVRLWVSTVSAHVWQRLTYVVCLNVYSVSVWYPHTFWGSLWVWSPHTHGAGAGLCHCVCTPLCGGRISGRLELVCVCLPLRTRAHPYAVPAVCGRLPCAYTLGSVVAVQVCGRACICCMSVCTCVCRSCQVCAPGIRVCTTGGHLGSLNLLPFSLPPSFPLFGHVSQEQSPGGDLSHVSRWGPPML